MAVCCFPYGSAPKGALQLRPFRARIVGTPPIIPLITVSSVGNRIDWGDGSAPYTLSAPQETSSYALPGVYTVSIYGNNDITITGAELVEVLDWGDYQVQHIQFYDAGLLATSPTLLTVPSTLSPYITSTKDMFRSTALFNQDLSGWDTSNVTDMSGMFQNTAVYNRPLNSWDTSNVVDMSNMFSGTLLFNSDLSAWDVSSVQLMTSMFENSLLYNRDLSGWCVSAVTDHTNFASGAILWLSPKPNFASPPC